MFHSDKVARLVGSGHSRLHPPIKVGWGQAATGSSMPQRALFFCLWHVLWRTCKRFCKKTSTVVS